MACPCCGPKCCCKADGTITELTAGQSCDGTTYSKPSVTCDWAGVTLTITVNGTSGTASVDDWINGIEPDFVGLGPGALPNGKYLDTTGLKSCTCNLRSIGLSLNYSNACFLTLTINECTNTAIITVDASPACTDQPTISAEVNWAP